MSRVFLFSLILTALSAPAFAEEPAKAAEPTPAKLEVRSLTEADAAPVDPARAEAMRIERQQRLALHAEMTARIEKAKKDVQALEEQFLAATDPAAQLAVQKQISEVKKESRLDLMRIQLRHAEAAGRTEQVKEISAAIQKMTNPQIERAATPVVRTQRQTTQEAGQ